MYNYKYGIVVNKEYYFHQPRTVWQKIKYGENIRKSKA